MVWPNVRAGRRNRRAVRESFALARLKLVHAHVGREVSLAECLWMMRVAPGLLPPNFDKPFPRARKEFKPLKVSKKPRNIYAHLLQKFLYRAYENAQLWKRALTAAGVARNANVGGLRLSECAAVMEFYYAHIGERIQRKWSRDGTEFNFDVGDEQSHFENMGERVSLIADPSR